MIQTYPKTYLFLMITLLVLSIVAICHGSLKIPARELLILLDFNSNPLGDNLVISQYVLFQIRLPRLITGLIVGGGLAAAGVSMQALFRNPLADPALIGVSNGAAVGAVSTIVLGAYLPNFVPTSIALPLAAFAAGFLAVMVVVAISSTNGRTDTAMLLLAGIAINAICGAVIGLLSYIADDNQLRDLTFWSMGSVAKTQWSALWISIPLIVIPCALLMRFSHILNCLLMGEHVAQHIGHDVKQLKLILIVLSTIIVATAVSISGVIMFIGLVVPHLVRLGLGPDHRQLLPISIMVGSGLLVCADLFARTLISPAELPIGLLMSLIGGPFFIYLLLQQKKQARLV